MQDGNGDGLDIKALNFSYENNFDQSENIRVNHCTFDSNRRNNLSVTGGTEIIIENSRFTNAGVNTGSSNGANPKAAIDVEAFKGENEDTEEVIDYEIAENIIIRNNVETGSARLSFYVASGREVTIENNDVETTLGFGKADNIDIYNNSIIGNSSTGNGIRAGKEGFRVFKNKIHDNKIENFQYGMKIEGDDLDIYNNEVLEFSEAGIRTTNNVTNTLIIDNSFKSTLSGSMGLFFYFSSGDNILVSGNKFESIYKPFKIYGFNEFNPQNLVTISNNTFDNPSGQAEIGRSSGVLVADNTINAGIRVIQNADNIEISDNVINSGGVFAVEIISPVKSLDLLNNSITTTKYQCIHIRDQEPSEYVNTGNTCN